MGRSRSSMSTLLCVGLTLAPVSNARATAPAPAPAPAPAEATAPAEAETTAPVEVPAPSEAPPPELEDAATPTEALAPAAASAAASAPSSEVASDQVEPSAPVTGSPQAAPSIEASSGPSARPDAIDLPPLAPKRTADQAPDRMNRGAEALIGVGVASLTVGAATLLFVSWPAWGLHNWALDRARGAELRSETWEFADKAARRRRVAAVALGIGASLSAAGIAMLTSGLIKRRQNRRLSVAPVVGGGFAGASTTLRF